MDSPRSNSLSVDLEIVKIKHVFRYFSHKILLCFLSSAKTRALLILLLRLSGEYESSDRWDFFPLHSYWLPYFQSVLV